MSSETRPVVHLLVRFIIIAVALAHRLHKQSAECSGSLVAQSDSTASHSLRSHDMSGDGATTSSKLRPSSGSPFIADASAAPDAVRPAQRAPRRSTTSSCAAESGAAISGSRKISFSSRAAAVTLHTPSAARGGSRTVEWPQT